MNKRKCKYCDKEKSTDDFFTKFMCKRCRTTRKYDINKVWKKKNKEKIRFDNLRYTYGITEEEYNSLFTTQQGRCKICGRHQSELESKLCVDHNHKTGQIRGLLCKKCNWALGLLNEDIQIINSMLEYIDEF